MAGLLLLVVGAEALVRGATRIAAAAGISPLIIGLTIVACGTSAPEMVVSTLASAAGRGDIALGNVVGSNIFNILLILGISALITPLVVSVQLIRFDVPLMIGVSGLAFFFARDGRIDRAEGLILVAGLVTYTVVLIRLARFQKGATAEFEKEYGETKAGSWLTNLLLVVAGLALLVLGSRWLVEGAVSLARSLGASELVIGLTIVAAGTSLPEVATSILASVRGERDIAVGNVIGSNLFNLLGVLGIAGALAPKGVPVAASALSFDLPIMMGAALLCLPIFFSGRRIARAEGALFLALYVAYIAYLVLTANAHAEA